MDFLQFHILFAHNSASITKKLSQNTLDSIGTTK